MSEQGCAIEACERPHHARGYCSLHYRRLHNNGDPTKVLDPHQIRRYERRPIAERFWEKVEKVADGCWRWTGALSDTGYGSFFVEKRGGRSHFTGAHRWAYENTVGPIPADFHLDHLCRTPACVNPAHLEPVTCAENVRRGFEARRQERAS